MAAHVRLENEFTEDEKYHTRKNPKISDIRKICCNHPKIWTRWLYYRVMCPKGAVWSGSTLFALPWARHFTPQKYWLITQEAMAPSRYDWKIVDWDVKPQHNQPTNTVCPDLSVRKLRKITVISWDGSINCWCTAGDVLLHYDLCRLQQTVTATYRNDPKFSDRYAWANSADPDQTAPRGAVWSGSTLFAIPSASFGLITLWKSHIKSTLFITSVLVPSDLWR